MNLERDIALGPRFRVLAVFKIPRRALERQILPPHDVFRRNRLQRTDNLQLFIPNGIRVKVIGRLHRDQAKKLHQVVLHHVAHGTRLVIVGPAPFNPDRFRHGDLDMIDELAVPERFKQDIGEAHCHQVLDGFLAQIVVDAIDLPLFEMAREHSVQRPCRPQVTTKGLFHNDARVGIGDLMAVQFLGQLTKKRRRDREIEGPHHIGAHHLFQLMPAILAFGGVDRDIVQPVKKLGNHRRILTVLGNKFRNGLCHKLAKARPVHFGARGPDDAAFTGDLA